LLCGLPAAYHLLRRKASVSLVEILKEGGRGSAMGPPRSRLRNGLMVYQVAMALVLMVGAGLMVRTFHRLLIMGPGYETKHLLTMQIALPAVNYREPARITEFYDQAVRELAALQDTKVAGGMAYTAAAEGFFIEGRPEPRPGETIPGIRSVSDQYVQALGLPLLSGRFLSERDRAESPRVVLLSESLVQHYWPRFRQGGEDPVGRHIRLAGKDSPWLTVVGVVGDIKDWFNQRPTPLAYVPYAQRPELSMQLVMRTGGDPLRAVPAARAALRKVDPDRPVYEVKTMEQWISEATSGVRASATSMTIYAVIALLLAVTGIYAVVAYAVVQRTHEIGVRMALGAGRGEILRMTLAYALRMAAMGLAIGVPAAFLLMRFVSRLLYDVVVVDPFTIAEFAAILGAAALAAGYVPARQATRVDPLVALRVE